MQLGLVKLCLFNDFDWEIKVPNKK